VPTKRLICLANSRKLSGRCVAGVELVGTASWGWVRPVSARQHEEVSEYERQYQDGSDPRVLDVIDVPLLRPLSKTFQRENWLLDPDEYWIKVGRAKAAELTSIAQTAGDLWINGHSTYHGLHDSIPECQAHTLRSSLELIHVDDLSLRVFAPGIAFGDPKRRVQGRFTFARVQYGLWVTDPVIERRYKAMQDGTYEVGECFLTVSIGEPHNDVCYKLITAVILEGS
jgi:hypothetical protein